MKWQLVDPQTRPKIPWKNGAGLTRELLTWPEADAWRWRLSIADIDRDADFSAFPGVARWVCLLSGPGADLWVNGRLHRLDVAGDPVAFAGEDTVSTQLQGGPCQDYNLMVRGPHRHAGLRRCRGGGSASLAPDTHMALWSGTRGARLSGPSFEAMAVPAHHLVWAHTAQADRVDWQAEDGLWAEVQW